VAQQERKIVVDGAFTVMEIGMANATGFYPNQCFAGARIRNQDGHQLNWRALARCDYSINLMGH
jgi:hypothetical protein